MKANINTVSFDGIKRVSYENEQQNLEIDISPDNYCQDCGQLHEHCHLKVHGNYIKKKIFTTYRDKSELCGTDHILSSIQEAYNESRRVDYCNRFRFYDATDENVPGCVQRLACKLVSNVQELRQASIINREIKNGIVQLIRAKRFRRAWKEQKEQYKWNNKKEIKPVLRRTIRVSSTKSTYLLRIVSYIPKIIFFDTI